VEPECSKTSETGSERVYSQHDLDRTSPVAASSDDTAQQATEYATPTELILLNMMMISTSPALRAMAMLALLSTADSFAPSAMLGSRAAVRGLRAGQRAGSVASQAAALRRAPPRACAGLRMQQEQNEGGVDPLDRFVACLPYALPLADSFEWGHYVFDAFPLATIPFLPLFPVIQLLNLPFVSFGIFIILFSFVARNPAFSRTVRFNTLQVELRAYKIARACQCICVCMYACTVFRKTPPICSQCCVRVSATSLRDPFQGPANAKGAECISLAT